MKSPLFFLMMLPLGFVGILLGVTLLSFLLPNFPDAIYFGLVILGLVILCSWMVWGIVKSQLVAFRPSADITNYLVNKGFQAEHKLSTTSYFRAVNSGIKQVNIKKGPTHQILEILCNSTGEAFFCVGCSPLLLSPFTQTHSLPVQIEAQFESLTLKAPNACCFLEQPRWQKLLSYLDQHHVALFTHQGEQSVLREGAFYNLEQFKSLYALLEALMTSDTQDS